MSFVPGKTGGVIVAQFDMSTDMTQYNFGRQVAQYDSTTFPAAGSGPREDRVYTPGLGEGGVSVQGIWNPAANASDEELVALDSTPVVISCSPQGFNTIGDRVHMVYGNLENYQPRSPVNDVVRFSAGFKPSAGAYLGTCLHEHSAETGTGNHTSVDGGAQTTAGATAFLHVTAFSGTNATVTIQDSANDSTFGSLVAFAQATGVTSEKVTVAGTVERYVRVNLAGTFSSITFVVSFARHR